MATTNGSGWRRRTFSKDWKISSDKERCDGLRGMAIFIRSVKFAIFRLQKLFQINDKRASFLVRQVPRDVTRSFEGHLAEGAGNTVASIDDGVYHDHGGKVIPLERQSYASRWELTVFPDEIG